MPSTNWTTMTECIMCKMNVDDNGTYFRSLGNYGSTVFDPMDGSYLDIIICNGCLEQNAKFAVCGRESKPVICEGMHVGKTPTPGRKEVPFDPAVMGSYDYDDVLMVDREELGEQKRLPEIEWDKNALAYFKHDSEANNNA